MQIAIAVSVAIHLLLLSLAVWEMGRGLAARLAAVNQTPVVVEEEITLLYPEQVLLPEEPPPPKEEPKNYIRTTQNTTATEVPEKANFISDRNTVAATELPADPEGDQPMPTQEGIDKPMLELADRDYKDGEIKEDGTTPVPAMPVQPPTPAAPNLDPVLAQPAPPPAPPPQSPPQSPPAPPPAPPMEIAKAEPATPLEAMMRERDDSDAARLSLDRLPLEVRNAEAPADKPMPDPEPPAPPPDPAQAPPALEMRQPAADSVPRAVPVPEPVTRTAGPADADSFSPFTRTSKARGTLSNRGEAAVNAAETPVGRYMRQVTSAVEKKWHSLRRTNADAVTFGSLKLRFYVQPDGSVNPPTLLTNPKDADARMVDFTLRAILEAEIPPIPQDLLPLLEGRRLEVEYDVLIY